MDITKRIILKPKEEILETIREVWVTKFSRIAIIIIWFIVPFFFMFPLFGEGVFGVVFFFTLVFSALIIGWRWYVQWNQTVFVITDRRIVDVEQKGFFDRVVSELPFTHIDDVSFRVKGFVPTLLRYGTITIRTRGSAADLEFERAKYPERLHDLINDLREEILNETRNRKKEQIHKLAGSMSMNEVKDLARAVRRQDQEKNTREFFDEDHHA